MKNQENQGLIIMLWRLKTVSKIFSCWTILALIPAIGNAACPGDEILQVQRPVEEGSVVTFGYKFRYKCVDPNLPTVIVIPGGPGSTSIERSDNNLIPNANTIFTDPRGTGENKSFWASKTTDKRVTTEDVASDVISIVKKLGLKNYVLYGSSFGTAVATIAGHKIENDPSLTPPKAIVLVGSIGKALTGDEQGIATRKLWDLVKSEAQYCLDCKAKELVEKYSSIQVGSLIEILLQEGSSGNYVRHYFNNSSEQELQPIMAKVLDLFSAEQLRLYQNIGCHEFTAMGMTNMDYQNGQLVTIPKETCKGRKMDSPFDSKKWPIRKAKLIYFAGTHDIATPFDQTAYHYENQPQAKKQLVCVDKAGHSSLSLNLADCGEQLWSVILSGRQDFTAAASNCGRAELATVSQCAAQSLQ